MLDNTYFWIGLAFLIFVWIVVRFAGKTIVGALDERAERIRRELEEAQTLRDEAQQALAHFQRKQRDALKEAENIVAAAREEADRIRRQAALDLEESLKRREAQAVDKIAQAEAQAVQQVRDLAVDIAIAATEKLLVQSIDQAKGEELIDNAIAEVGTRLH